MKRNIIYVGLDVDDTQYHGSALDENTGEVIDFKCRPTLKGLLDQLEQLGKRFPRWTFKLCYEATYIGYTLQRVLAAKGAIIVMLSRPRAYPARVANSLRPIASMRGN